MNTVLIDSDILIEVLRQRDSAIQSVWEKLAGRDVALFYSPVTGAEIWQGVREREREFVTALFRAMTCVPIDAEIGRKAGEYLRQFRCSHNVALGDALIAATAAIHEVPLWTGNRKHYPMKEVRLF